MASVYERYYERQPAAVKVIAVAGVALLSYSLYRSFKKSQDEKDANTAAQLANAELQQLAQQGIRPTLSALDFENMAQTVVTAVDGCGTDEDAIYSVFNRLRNDADIRQFISTFGIRYTQPCAATQPISYALWLADDKSFGGPLGVFLRYDLGDSEIAQINNIMRSKGINFQF